jgi:hypothetical protein
MATSEAKPKRSAGAVVVLKGEKTLLRNIMFYQQQSTPGKRVSARPNNK